MSRGRWGDNVRRLRPVGRILRRRILAASPPPSARATRVERALSSDLMAAIDAAKHRFGYTGGGSPGARRDTLVEDGPLVLPPGHFFAVVLSRSPDASGSVPFTYRETEFLLGETFIPSPAFMALSQAWALAPAVVLTPQACGKS